MPRKKTVEEAEFVVKEEDKNVEVVEESKKCTQKAFFFPRLVSYILDVIIVSFVVVLITSFFPSDSNYDKYLKEFETIQTNYLEKEISSKEYLNKIKDVTYDLDKCSVPTTIVQIVVIIGYFIVLPCYNKGQTLGKKLMHIRIVSDSDEELTLNNYLFRSAIINSLLANMIILGMVLFISRDIYYFSSFIIQGVQVVLVVISVLMILFRKDGRGLHDRVAHTKVIMCD